jgi:four helix bundle protein
MQDFKKLIVWQKPHILTIAVYRTTEAFPEKEMFGLTSQIRRAYVSIPANIAEGCGREGRTEFNRFLQIALGSIAGLEYHLLLSGELGFINQTKYMQLDIQ